MEHVYTFLGGAVGFGFLSKKEFKAQFGVAEAQGYLNEIRNTLNRDALTERRAGHYYTGVRHAFAEIDGLGKLYRGEVGQGDTAANAIAFGRRFLGQVDARYRNLFGLLFELYRHGLSHSHLVRTVRFWLGTGPWQFLYWELREDRKHLHLRRNGKAVVLAISVPQLVEDTIAALDLYATLICRSGPKSAVFGRFRNGYYGTSVVFRDAPLPATPLMAKARPKNRSAPKKLVLKSYSRDGMAYIRKWAAKNP